MSRGTRTIEIYRYDPDKDTAPRMQSYTIELLDSDRMLLDLLIRLKQQDETITFRRSCREGICGSDGMNINGRNGLACLINLNSLPEKITVRPLPGLPVVRDLVIDMNQFYEQYENANRFAVDSRDTDTRARLLRLEDPFSLFRCRGIMNCVLYCPKGLNPTKAIGNLRNMLINQAG